jgi:uncharacterized protein YbjT (DUF2867 family)
MGLVQMQQETVSHDKSIVSRQRILVTGATGFIGSRVVKRLMLMPNYDITCITRNQSSFENEMGVSGNIINVLNIDAMNYEDLLKGMNGIDTAFYLIHSMEGSSKNWKKFADRDRIAAQNFARAATANNVRKIIYLGGLTHANKNEMSEHMLSRTEVGDILRTSSAKVTIFRAAVILGQGGGSFQMLKYLVERLPLMVCPKWVLTKTQPIGVEDVVEYLVRSIDISETDGKTFDIGGEEVLTYLDMMKRYATLLNKTIRIVIIPFLTPRLSSYWVDLITPVKASLARPLIDSLKHEATVGDNSIRKIIPMKLKKFEDAVKSAMNEQAKKNSITRKERTSSSLNNKILLTSLVALSVLGSTYYFLDARKEIFQINWLLLSCIWYSGILFSFYFVLKGARLGFMIAGILGWLTLAFWLGDNFYILYGKSLIASVPNYLMTIRNFVGVVIVALVISSAHNMFHKIRYQELK